jgi:hypothetical protein
MRIRSAFAASQSCNRAATDLQQRFIERAYVSIRQHICIHSVALPPPESCSSDSFERAYVSIRQHICIHSVVLPPPESCSSDSFLISEPVEVDAFSEPASCSHLDILVPKVSYRPLEPQYCNRTTHRTATELKNCNRSATTVHLNHRAATELHTEVQQS